MRRRWMRRDSGILPMSYQGGIPKVKVSAAVKAFHALNPEPGRYVIGKRLRYEIFKDGSMSKKTTRGWASIMQRFDRESGRWYPK